MIAQLGNPPLSPVLKKMAEETCQECALYEEASSKVCQECPGVTLLRKLIEGNYES